MEGILEKVKSYLIIPQSDSYEDEHLVNLIEMAKANLAISGINIEDVKEHYMVLYDLAICMLVCFWHENQSEQGVNPEGVINLINQIRWGGLKDGP